MIDLSRVLAHLYPEADPASDYRVLNHPDGYQEITAWNLSTPQPTQEKLEAAYPDALREEKRAEVHRRAAEETERTMPRHKREHIAREIGRGRGPRDEAKRGGGKPGRDEERTDRLDEIALKAAELEARLEAAASVEEIERLDISF